MSPFAELPCYMPHALASDFAYCNRCYRSVVCLSICLSVTFMHALCLNGRRYLHDFFCLWQPHISPRSR